MSWRDYLQDGNRLYREKRYEAALALHRRALILRPNNVQVLCTVARDWIALGEPEEALRLVLRAADLAPDYPDAQYMLARLRRILGLSAGSERMRPGHQLQTRAEQPRGMFHRAPEEYGQFFASPYSGQEHRAYRRAGEELSLTPPESQAISQDEVKLSQHSYELLVRQNYRRAFEVARELVKLAPHNAYGYYLMGYALEKMRRYTDAANYYQLAIDRGRTGGSIIGRLERLRLYLSSQGVG